MADTLKKCTLLVCSCDKYEDAWFPFFKLLKTYWPNLEYPIMLNTESKHFEYENLNIKTLNLFREKTNVQWGERMLAHLHEIDTEYVIIMMDDFFLCKPVKTNILDKCIQYMQANKEIASFNFYTVPGKNIDDKRFEGFVRRPRCSDYKYNCQAGIWRTKQLESFIRKHESPWVWEVAANYRSWRSNALFYCAKDANNLIFDYYGDGNWSGIMRGKWYTKYVAPLFNKHGIEIDFTIRGIIEDKDVQAVVNEKRNPFIFFIKKLYGNTLCLLKNPKSIF